jgi:hypothetical protein
MFRVLCEKSVRVRMREYLWKFVCDGISFEWFVFKMLVYPQSLLRECRGGRIWVDHFARFGRGIEGSGFECLISFGRMGVPISLWVFYKGRCVLWRWSLLQQKKSKAGIGLLEKRWGLSSRTIRNEDDEFMLIFSSYMKISLVFRRVFR